MKTKLQFLLALVIAGIYRQWQELQGIREALRTESQVPDALAEKRLAECRKCPIYNATLQTCGSPLDYKTWDGGEPLGCFCFMPVKAKTLCNCWLSDKTMGQDGWQGELNSFPYAPQTQ